MTPILISIGLALIGAFAVWFAAWMLGAWANKPGKEMEGYGG